MLRLFIRSVGVTRTAAVVALEGEHGGTTCTLPIDVSRVAEFADAIDRQVEVDLRIVPLDVQLATVERGAHTRAFIERARQAIADAPLKLENE